MIEQWVRNPQPFAKNVELVSYVDFDPRNGNVKLAMLERDGRMYLYVHHLYHLGLSIVDVTDPEHPEVVRFLEGPKNTWFQVQAADNLLVTGTEQMNKDFGGTDEPSSELGIMFWDLTDPTDPQYLSTWHNSGGTHRNFYAGGRYVHAAPKEEGYSGNIYSIIDVENPRDPREVGRWWMPGQHVAGGETKDEYQTLAGTTGNPYMGSPGIHHHGGPYVEGDLAFCPWGRGGLVILDISDVTNPRTVSILPTYPPLGSSISVHTAVPLLDRGLVLVNSEALQESSPENPAPEPVNFVGVVDISDIASPRMISLFPRPEIPEGYPSPDFADRGGRFGPHNQHQPQGQPFLQPSGDLVYVTYFNAGLQIYDISLPHAPKNVGYYIPEDPEKRYGALPRNALSIQVEDVIVDRRGYIYISEKNSGIRVLKLSGDLADR